MAVKIAMSPQLRVTTQTVLGSQLLRLAEAGIEEAIAREIVDNPALECIDLDWSHDRSSYRSIGAHEKRSFLTDDDEGDVVEHVAERESVRDSLIHQARLLVPKEVFANVAYLIHSLDEHGFLITSFEELTQDMGISPELLDGAIAWLQQLDPPGLGARDIQECFSLQCLALEKRGLDCQIVRCILNQAWKAFTKQDWRHVARLSKCSLSEVHEAVHFIRHHCYLFPVFLLSDTPDDEPVFLRPDLVVRQSNQGEVITFTVEVPAADAIHLHINPAYRQSLGTSADYVGVLTSDERAWIQQAVERARTFMSALEQRYATLRQIGEFLISYQVDFFISGRRYLKPLTRAEVAQALGIHPSTVSRAVSDKILQLPDGRLIAMNTLFDASLAAKEALRELLTSCTEPISDSQIVERLRSQSFDLSRRTVAQYREELGIPSRSHRTRSQALAENTT